MCAQVYEYVKPEKYEFWKQKGDELGFLYTASGARFPSVICWPRLTAHRATRALVVQGWRVLHHQYSQAAPVKSGNILTCLIVVSDRVIPKQLNDG